jgi:hypothetical protein
MQLSQFFFDEFTFTFPLPGKQLPVTFLSRGWKESGDAVVPLFTENHIIKNTEEKEDENGKEEKKLWRSHLIRSCGLRVTLR